MPEYIGYKIVVRNGEAREIENMTDNPFRAFPELQKIFENFPIKELEFEVDVPELQKDIYIRVFFKIVRRD